MWESDEMKRHDGKATSRKSLKNSSAAEKRKIMSSLCGAWVDDATIAPIFEEIEKERHQYHGRAARYS
jgi:hypothetical protein